MGLRREPEAVMSSWRQGQALSQDLRERVLAASGVSAAVAERFGVSPSYVIKARQRRDRLGEMTAGAQRSHTPAKLAGHDDALRAEMARVPDATLADLRSWALVTLGVAVSLSTLSVRLKRLGLTLKKRRSPQQSKPAPM
jgi:transposase